jgi:ABC-type taurine transport system ATPase subunit
MSELVLEAVGDGPLVTANARFAAGASVVVGADAAALATLVAIVGGTRSPRRGRVLLDGAIVHESPALRGVTATLLADEALPARDRVSDAVSAVLRSRGDRRRAIALLDEVGLAAWGTRRSRDLDASERRALMLALALTHTTPRLLVLYEPLAAGRVFGSDFVLRGIERAAESGAVVLSATQSLDDARGLGTTPWLLYHGVLANVSGAPLGALLGGDHTFVVDTPDARRLTAALAHDPAVRGVRWNEEHAPDTLLVFGSDAERLASAIARTLSEQALRVRSIGLSPVPLTTLVPASTVPAPPAHGYGAPPPQGPTYASAPMTYPYVASPPAPSLPYPLGAATGAAPTAPAPPDQSVTMPTTFADPTRPRGGSES